MIKWVAEQRRLEIGISTNEIIYKLIELDPNENKRSFHALQVWCYAFLRRYGYGIRSITHAGQKLKENSKIEYEEFFRKLYSLRFKIGDVQNMCNIYNMDETPIWFEMISKNTVTKLGEKTVTKRTFGSERTRISVILCISADGQKIPPLLVFKGKKGGRKEEELKKNKYVQLKKIYVLCQNNSWADSDVFLFWINNIFFNNTHINNSLKKILIMDRATSHYDETLVDIFKKYNSYFILIPPGLTRFIQPLDVSINGPFKKAMHHWDIDFRIQNKNEKKPTPNDIINAVVDIWYNNTTIKQCNIINSFKSTGISINLDGSEQHLVHKHAELCDEIIIPNDVILEPNQIDIAENIGNNLNLIKEENNKEGNSKITDYFSISNGANMDIE